MSCVLKQVIIKIGNADPCRNAAVTQMYRSTPRPFRQSACSEKHRFRKSDLSVALQQIPPTSQRRYFTDDSLSLSVDSYKGGDKLICDYKRQYRFAEPFYLALETGEECFLSVYFSAMAHSRELCALGLRKHENYIKDAVEGIFEYVRRKKFADHSASRIGCVFYCASEDEARACLKADCIDNGDFSPEQVRLLKVDVDDARVFHCDQAYYNEATELMERTRDLKGVMALAEKYFSLQRSTQPIIEILSDGENHILVELPVMDAEP